MNHFSLVICSLFVLISCSDKDNHKKIDSGDESEKYEMVEVDSYGFRRVYRGHDALVGGQLDLFMNRNPEPNEDYVHSENHSFFNELCKIGLITEGNLNISELDTLPEQFNYQISKNASVQVKTKLLDDPKEMQVPSYELTFMDGNNSFLVDTLEFDWPPDVTFTKADLDGDGTEELLSVFRWYIINGENFDIKIYKLKK